MFLQTEMPSVYVADFTQFIFFGGLLAFDCNSSRSSLVASLPLQSPATVLQQLSTAILLSRVCFVCFLIHLSRALSSPLQLIVICLGPPNHLRHLLCRRCYDWIQALSCSLSMSLSRHIRYRTTMVDFRLFSDLVLQFLIPFNWAQNFYLQKCPLKLQNFQLCSLNLFLILFV